MLDWLRRDSGSMPMIEVAGQRLPVSVRRLSNARRMTLRLAPDGREIRVSMPRWGHTDEALAFARARIAWLERQLATVVRPEPPGNGGMIAFRGELRRIVHDSSGPRRIGHDGETLRIGGPADMLAARLRRWLQGQARAILLDDLAWYTAQVARSAPPLALSGAQRRWGSCAKDNTIRINWRLIMAPDTVRRSVVAHEVAHLVHFDHSRNFHALLDRLFEDDITVANRWLREHGRGLYAPFG